MKKKLSVKKKIKKKIKTETHFLQDERYVNSKKVKICRLLQFRSLSHFEVAEMAGFVRPLLKKYIHFSRISRF